MAQSTGILFNIQRFSLHDGPGIRTTVFLKGCNLRCAWCHNPESFLGHPQLSYAAGRCTHCGACACACANGVHVVTAEGHALCRERCTACGACADGCPAGALTVIGRRYTVDEVLGIITRDRKYYERSGGGVTFSGGEPTVQFAFLKELLKKSKAQGLHTCVETNGHTSAQRMEELCPLVDLFLFDYKVTGDGLSCRYVGADNRQPLANLELLNQRNKPVILRCPIIPGINDTPEHFAAIRALKGKYTNIQAVELMPYHSIGVGKWENLGLDYTLNSVEPPIEQRRKGCDALIDDCDIMPPDDNE